MEIADVYQRFDVTIETAKDCYLSTFQGDTILDLYGGHGVISIGHSHPHFKQTLSQQIERLVFYSNKVNLNEQLSLAKAIQSTAQLQTDYQLFLSNSGSEANENALKVAGFHTGRHKVLAFKGGFHGRTSLAVQCSDNPSIRSTLNQGIDVEFLPLNDFETASAAIDHTVAAVIIEGVQGIAGVNLNCEGFLYHLQLLCRSHGCLLIVDEVQSGFGRTGKMFSFQHEGFEPDIFTTVKGMGNGVPIAATFIRKGIDVKKGALGSTFGGNPLSCVAATSVCEVIQQENLLANAKRQGELICEGLKNIKSIKEVRGKGLMIAFDLFTPSQDIRSHLLTEHKL